MKLYFIDPFLSMRAVILPLFENGSSANGNPSPKPDPNEGKLFGRVLGPAMKKSVLLGNPSPCTGRTSAGTGLDTNTPIPPLPPPDGDPVMNVGPLLFKKSKSSELPGPEEGIGGYPRGAGYCGGRAPPRGIAEIIPMGCCFCAWQAIISSSN